MITIKVGNLFESRAQTLVNTVNCVGIMGKGIALEFKKRYPRMFKDYERRCAAGEVRLGRPYLYKDLVDKWILNFPTKDDWRSVARLRDIVEGLEYVENHYRDWGIRSLAVPPLGCGQGQLEWRVVGPTLYRHLSQLDVPVELYAPYGTPEQQLTRDFLSQATTEALVGTQTLRGSKIDPAWVVLIEILSRIGREPYHWPVGRTTFQKLAYFATVAGLPTHLRYVPGSYGPFAGDLKRIVTTLVNQGLIEEVKFGRMFRIRPGRTFADARQLARAEIDEWEAVIDRVADLMLRMKTEDAEIAASVKYVADRLRSERATPPTELEVRDAVLHWKMRRRPAFESVEVAQAVRHLNALGWVDLTSSPEFDPEDEELAVA
jgi:uncharacterized protein YwgA/O-acetyl-ADP-ribose deacetylase (regulator of RNase III)